MTLHLHGLGHFHPTNEITNRFLEELDIGTSDEWIMERVGIRSRRTTLPLDYIRATRNADTRAGLEAADVTNPQMAAHAARMAIERAGIEPSQIGMVVSGPPTSRRSWASRFPSSTSTRPARACSRSCGCCR